MRLRLLACFVPATLITGLLLVSASSFVSAVDTKLTPVARWLPPVQLHRYETRCDVLSIARSTSYHSK